MWAPGNVSGGPMLACSLKLCCKEKNMSDLQRRVYLAGDLKITYICCILFYFIHFLLFLIFNFYFSVMQELESSCSSILPLIKFLLCLFLHSLHIFSPPQAIAEGRGETKLLCDFNKTM